MNPGISSKVKCCTKVASTTFISAIANLFPMHDREPAENGRKVHPRTAAWLSFSVKSVNKHFHMLTNLSNQIKIQP